MKALNHFNCKLNWCLYGIFYCLSSEQTAARHWGSELTYSPGDSSVGVRKWDLPIATGNIRKERSQFRKLQLLGV